MEGIQLKYHSRQQISEGFMAQVMGTRLRVLIAGIPQKYGEEIWQWAAEELCRMDRMMNRFSPHSELSRFNADPLNSPLSDELEQILLSCIAYREKTCGLFDVTRGGQDNVDLGGFAKGYALKVVQERMRNEGVHNVLMDFGGSTIVAMGNRPEGKGWPTRLASPFTGKLLHEFELHDETLSTSGNTPGYTAHIVHPRAGVPVTGNRLSVVMAPDALDAEVLSTALLIASPAERERITSTFSEIKAWQF